MLDGLTLAPNTIDTIAMPIIAGVLAVYFLLLRPPSATTRVLAAFFSVAVLFGLTAAFSTAARGHLVQHAQFLFLIPSTWLLVAFAYLLQGNAHPKESRWVLGVAGGVGLVLMGSVVYNLATTDFWVPINALPYQGFALLLLVYATVVFLRKSRLPSHNRRVQRAFAWLLITLVTTLTITLVGPLGFLSREAIWSVYAVLFLLFFVAFGFLYIYHAPTPTSFQVQVVGLSLLTVIAVLALVNRTSISSEVGGAVDVIALESQAAFEIRPAAGQSAYAATAIPYTFDWDLGERLVLEAGTEMQMVLDQPFPFAGSTWDTLYVNRNGLVALGQSYRPRFLEEFYNGTPKIAPLNIALREGESGGVYAKQDSGTVTLTWHQMSQPDFEHTATFQLVLFSDGVFAFRYSNLNVAIREGMRGAYWGAPRPRWNALLPSLHEQGTTAVLVEDFSHQYKRRVHARMLPLFYSLLGATLFILVVFPPVFRLSLVRPVKRLLTGMQQVNDGQLDVTVPVATRDEVGRLTEHFNQVTASLRQADEEVRSYAEHLEDMVDQRTAQIAEQKDQLEAQAHQLRALDAAKSRFFANISHEFRTPLTLILGPLERAETAEAALLPNDRAMMKRNALRLRRLINQILDLARLEAGSLTLNLETHDLDAFTQRQTSLFQGEAQYREIELVYREAAAPCPVAIDPVQMEKVIANLLSNALKFTPAGGRIMVSCTPAEEAHSIYAALVVEDTGTGIPAEAVPHVFDRFYQVDDTATRTQEGSGIGLALVKEVVHLHSGTVMVSSTLGKGATFTVLLPLVEPMPEGLVETDNKAPDALEAGSPIEIQPVSAAEVASADDHDQTTVLVVEDNPDMRAFIASILAPDFRVIEAADGQEGLAEAKLHMPDLILADVMMPNMDGLSLSRALKAHAETDTIPLILLTARASTEDAIEGLTTGADAYLTKPFHAEALKLQVQNVIQRQQRLRERLAETAVPIGSPEEETSVSHSPFEEQVRAVIAERLTDPALSVEDVAEALHMTRFQLLRQLQETAGVKPRQLIIEMRMDAAVTLLRARAGTVAEVGYAVGFNSRAYFSRRFRAHFGVSPSEYVG